MKVVVCAEHPCAQVQRGSSDASLALGSATGVGFCFVMQKLKIVALNSALKLFILLLCSLLTQELAYGDIPDCIHNTLPFHAASYSPPPLSFIISQIPKPGYAPAAREAQVLGRDLEAAACLLWNLF